MAPLPEKTPETMDHLDAVPSLPGLMDNKWALQYINVAHLQSILEAIDDDGTGFVSIKEANTFAIERPKDWRRVFDSRKPTTMFTPLQSTPLDSLLGKRYTILSPFVPVDNTEYYVLHVGWEMSLADYKNKILLILQEMAQLREEVLMENRYHVDTYLYYYAIAGVELVMRATKTTKEYTTCFELVSLTNAHTSVEEERLRKNLENIRYDMDSGGTVTLVTGPGRIERVRWSLVC